MSKHGIEEYYDINCDAEDTRLTCKSLEYLMTRELLLRYIKDGCRVIDIGGGTGVYSILLCEKKCDVTLVDISQKELDKALQKSEHLGLNLKCVHNAALDIDSTNSEKYDALLCLGPLYHAQSENEISATIQNCIDLLKQGGVGFLSFISVYAKFNHFLSNISHYNEADLRVIKRSWEERSSSQAVLVFEYRNNLPVSFILPESIRVILEKFKVEILDIVSVDIMQNIGHLSFSDELFKLLYDLGSGYSLNSGEHIVVTFRKL